MPSQRPQVEQTSEKRSAHDVQTLSVAKNSPSHATAPLCVWTDAFATRAHLPSFASDVPAAQIEHDDPSLHDSQESGQSPHVSPDAKCFSEHLMAWLLATRRASCSLDWAQTPSLPITSRSSHRRCAVSSKHRRAPSQSTHCPVPTNVSSGHVKHRLSLKLTLFIVLVHVIAQVPPIATLSSQTKQTAPLSVTLNAVCETGWNDPCTAPSQQTSPTVTTLLLQKGQRRIRLPQQQRLCSLRRQKRRHLKRPQQTHR